MFPADAGLGGPPRPGVGPVTLSASHRAGPRLIGGTSLSIDTIYAVVKLENGLVDADKYSFPLYSSGVPRVGPASALRGTRGAFPGPRTALATVIKLQTDREFQCLDVAHDFLHEVESMMSERPDFLSAMYESVLSSWAFRSPIPPQESLSSYPSLQSGRYRCDRGHRLWPESRRAAPSARRDRSSAASGFSPVLHSAQPLSMGIFRFPDWNWRYCLLWLA